MLFNNSSRVPFIIGVLVVVLMLFMIYKQSTSLSAARDAMAQEQQAIANVQLRLQNLKALENEADNIKRQLDIMQQKLPTEPSEDELIKYIKSSADKSYIDLFEISFGEYLPKEDYVEMPFQVNLNGRYSEVVEFLVNLQNGARLVSIDEVQVVKEGQVGSNIRADISGSSYYVSK
ncbi:MAG: hypothetical protein FH758_09905 [Firmicutes bacterium]|nr:hypothetical protein [Bacillota bacterium]